MAAVGGGVYVDAGLRSIELDRIYEDIIAKMDAEQREYEARKVDRGQAWHWLFALAGLALLVIESLVPERSGRAAAARPDSRERTVA